MKLHDKYTTSALIHLIHIRYGLTQLGFKQLLRVSTTRYHNLKRGKEELGYEESLQIVCAFPELSGRFNYKAGQNGN